MTGTAACWNWYVGPHRKRRLLHATTRVLVAGIVYTQAACQRESMDLYPELPTDDLARCWACCRAIGTGPGRGRPAVPVPVRVRSNRTTGPGLGWIDRAACAGMSPDLWDLDSPAELRVVGKRVCDSCPVPLECRAAAYRTEDQGVVRGGEPLDEPLGTVCAGCEGPLQGRWARRFCSRQCFRRQARLDSIDNANEYAHRKLAAA